jgi:pimeloyl-ACP methyl ester carboxylesterase
MGRITVNTAILANGLTVPYGVTGNPAATPVVFVHAYVESWRYFEVVLGHLPASLHGYAPTQRGHGDADRPADGYLAEDFAADIVGFMDVVGIRRAVLVGSSSGGLVSQLVASTYPDRVSALVLISSPASLADKPGVAAMWQAISVLEDPLDRGFVEEFVRSTSPESVPDELVDTLIDESLKVPARVWKETLRGLIEADMPADLDRILAPTLLISGDRDAFVSSDQDVILAGIPDARLVLYKGVGHGVHLAQPIRVVNDIVDFLARPAQKGTVQV